jgi:hypothetical protein
MIHPVVNATGVTFEQSAILAWIDCGNKYCPVTGIAMTAETLTTNTALQWKIRYWQHQQQQEKATTDTATTTATVEDTKDMERNPHTSSTAWSRPVPFQYKCPLTKTLIQDAVMTRQGYNFERSAIHQWLAVYSVCPVSGKSMSLKDIVTNAKLQWEIQQWQQQEQNDKERATVSSAQPVEVVSSLSLKSNTLLLPITKTTEPQEQEQALVRKNYIAATSSSSDDNNKIGLSRNHQPSSNNHRPNVTKFLDMSNVMGRPLQGHGEDTLHILNQVDKTLDIMYHKSQQRSQGSGVASSVAALVQ